MRRVLAIAAAALALAGCASEPFSKDRPELRPASSRPETVRPAPTGAPAVRPPSTRPAPTVAVDCPGAPERYDAAFTSSARRWLPVELREVGPVWLAAQDCIESHWRTDAVSPAGAIGVPQLMPATAGDVGVREPHVAEEAIPGGARYMTWCYRQWRAFPELRTDRDRWELALVCYNGGMLTGINGQMECGGIYVDDFIECLPQETQQYVYRWRVLVFGTSAGPREA